VGVLKYRLPDPAVTGEGRPYPMQDAVAALQLMHHHAREWHVDPNRIGIVGGSAGGHLAGSVTMLDFTPAEIRPRFVALLYPVVCMEGPYVNAGSRDALLGPSPAKARLEAFSLEQHAKAGLPPFFVVHAKDDRAVPYQNSELLTAALRAQGVAADLMLVATGGHGFGLGRDAESSRWMDPFLGWLDGLP
jgi:acetyl esterase/lipase